MPATARPCRTGFVGWRTRRRHKLLAKRFGSSHSVLTPSRHAECHREHRGHQSSNPMKRLASHRTLPAALAALLLSILAAGASTAIVRNAPVPPPVIGPAVIPETAHPRRAHRYTAARCLRFLLLRCLRAARSRRVSRAPQLGLQPPGKAWRARGPPRIPSEPEPLDAGRPAAAPLLALQRCRGRSAGSRSRQRDSATCASVKSLK
jgi:hypothetical protein